MLLLQVLVQMWTLLKRTSLLLFIAIQAQANIGSVTDFTGSAAIERDEGFEVYDVEKDLGVEMMDIVAVQPEGETNFKTL